MQIQIRETKAVHIESHELLLEEVRQRDETIAKLHQDHLKLQENRDGLMEQVFLPHDFIFLLGKTYFQTGEAPRLNWGAQKVLNAEMKAYQFAENFLESKSKSKSKCKIKMTMLQ